MDLPADSPSKAPSKCFRWGPRARRWLKSRLVPGRTTVQPRHDARFWPVLVTTRPKSGGGACGGGRGLAKRPRRPEQVPT